MFQRQTPYLFLLVPLVFMVLFIFVPMILAFGVSLLNYSHDIYHPAFVGLDNYVSLWHSSSFWRALWNTIVFVLGVVPAMVTIPIAMAVMVNTSLKGISVIRLLIYLPVVVSMVVVGIAWKWLLADEGLVNYFLSLMGISKVGWLVNPDIALISVMMVVVWKGLAYYMMMYLAHLQHVSKDLYEAAAVDGATQWGAHRHVTIPHLIPTMTMVALISTIGGLKVFTEIYVMTRGGPVASTQTLVYFIYQRAFEYLDLGMASAAGLVLMLILLGLSILQLKFSGSEGSGFFSISKSRKKLA